MRHNPEPMRHVPEEELHAYLDQALSRSQCVEIEHHLAGCHVCRAERDGIAALRDRTTALLVAAAPRRIRPRPFAHLSAAHVERASRRTRLLRGAGWAASVVAAIGLGWGLNQWSTPDTATSGQPTAAVASTAGQPPETSIRWPVIQWVRRTAAIASPMSSAPAIRPSAVIPVRCAWTSGVSRINPPLKSVATGPGAITLAVMPRGPSSAAM